MMEIQTVKYSGDGFLVNGNMSVPNAEGNRHYQMVQQWIAEGNTPEPEFTAEELATQELASFRSNRDNLLKESDVYALVDKYNALTAEQQAELIEYRQSLRDSTQSMMLPTKPTWMA